MSEDDLYLNVVVVCGGGGDIALSSAVEEEVAVVDSMHIFEECRG